MAAVAKPRRKVNKKVNLPSLLPIGFTVDDIFKNKWVIGDKIGSGGCGIVYLVGDARHSPKKHDFVMKVEFHENGPLYTEMHFYRNIGKPEHIENYVRSKKLPYLGMSACHGLGSFEHDGSKCRFLVLHRYGTDLQKYLDEKKRFSLKTSYTVALSVLDVLQYLHSCGYIHGDVKAANLLRGRDKGTEHHVYLVDMGLATKFITNAGHRKESPDPKKAHNGTIEYTSRDSHRGTPCTRRSDLETLGYNLLMWLSGSLPWVGLTDVKKVAQIKEQNMSDVKKFVKSLFGNKIPSGIMEYLIYVQELGFEEDPDYAFLRKTLTSAIKSEGFRVDGMLSFDASPSKMKKQKIDETFPSSSVKENVVKEDIPKGSRKRKVVKRPATQIVLEPGIKPTPAMLEILNKRK